MRRASLVLLLAAGCTGEPTLPEPAPRDTGADPGDTDGDTDGGQACDLALTPAESFVLPLRDVAFTLRGGTGQASYRLATDASGALLDEDTGRYLSGITTEVTDVVVATDAGCPGAEARAEVRVIASMTLAPLTAKVPPGVSFDLEIRGGSGRRECALLTDASGAVLDGCRYTAGARPGIDEIVVTDPVTGQQLQAAYTVEPGAVLRTGAPRYAVPVGRAVPLPITGGSGHHTVVSAGVGEVVDGVFFADRPGVAVLSITDRFVGLEATLPVDVMPARAPGSEVPDGHFVTTEQVWGAGDLDGDGYDDVVVADSSASSAAWRGGVVAVYRGGPRGLEASPSWTWSGESPGAYGGRHVALGDFDGDGETDLAIGAFSGSHELPYDGRVEVFGGVTGGLFEDAPRLAWTGEDPYDRLGHGLTACDLDGDGYDDLAVSAYTAEDETYAPVAWTQGVVDVHLGGPLGLVDLPDQRIWGIAPDDDGGWEDRAGLQLGLTLGSGDLDGDGRCDLITSSWNRGLAASGAPGAVFAHRGTVDGVEPEPARAWIVDDADSDANLGRSLATGDVDGDGDDELLIGAWRRDRGGVSQHGAAYVVEGGPLDEGDTVVHVDELPWRVQDQRFDYLGYGVALDDVDGDGLAEVLVSGYYDEDDVNASGAVRIFSARRVAAAFIDGPVDATGDRPLAMLSGDVSYDLYGTSVAVLGDVDGDGTTDVGVYSARDSSGGPDVGALYTSAWDRGGPGTRRLLPRKAADHGYGEPGTLAWLDTDGDGASALLLGGPRDHDGSRGDTGRVVAYGPARDGVAATPGPDLLDRPDRTVLDRDGTVVVDAGDADGDGYRDLVVVSQSDDRPSWPGAAFEPRWGCARAASNTGSAWLLRGRRGDAIAASPSRVQWGPDASALLRAAAGGIDGDGDGYDDVLLGSYGMGGSRGGVAWMRGGPLTTSAIEVVCADGERLLHPDRGDGFGAAITGLGDLDGDGCDEAAIGAPYDDLTAAGEGTVYVLWGAGGADCPARPAVTALVSGESAAQLGASVHGGVDLTGDGVGDLAIGAPLALRGTERPGAAWLVSGADLVDLPRVPVDDVLPAEGAARPQVLGVNLPAQRVDGPWDRSYAGLAVALVPGEGLAVGAPEAPWGAVDRVGVVRVHAVEGGRLGAEPALVMIGDPEQPEGQFGRSLVGTVQERHPALAVGDPGYDGPGIDLGAAWIWRRP